MYDSSSSNVDGYNSFACVLNEVRDVYVDDLVRYTTRIPAESLQNLRPSPRGVYIRGMLEPIINFDDPTKRFYTESQFREKHTLNTINSFEEFVASKELIVDERGKVICTIPCMLRSYFLPTCDFNYSAINIAISEVWHMLHNVVRNNNICSTIPTNHLNPQYWLNDTTVPTCPFDVSALTDRVYDFVGRDFMNAYTVRIKNTTLYVEKGNDFRVVDYYRRIFEDIESQRFEQFGY